MKLKNITDINFTENIPGTSKGYDRVQMYRIGTVSDGYMPIKVRRVYINKKGRKAVSNFYASLVTYGDNQDIRLIAYANLVCEGDNKTLLKGEWFIGESRVSFRNPIQLGIKSNSINDVLMLEIL